MHKLYRARKDRRIGGICGGLGHYFQIDPCLMRLIMIFLCVLSGIAPILIAYLIGCLIIPLEPSGHKTESFKRLYRSRRDRKIAGICGGLSEIVHMDSAIMRLIFIFLCFLTGIVPMLIAYIIGWIIIPEAPNSRH